MEQITNVYEHFVEEFDLKSHPSVLAVLAYGSSIYNSDSAKDVDMMIVTSANKSYKAACLIDGRHFDIAAYSQKDIEKLIVYGRANGDKYIESVLKNSITVFDKNYIIAYLRSILGINISGLKRSINPIVLNETIKKFFEFLQSEENSDYLYYVALEALRKIIQVKLHVSYISELKVYKLYTNSELAKDKYCLDMPNDEFINLYLEALTKKRYEDRKKYLETLADYIVPFTLSDDCYEEQAPNEIKLKNLIISLNDLVNTAINDIINKTAYSECLYYLTINRISEVIKYAYKEIPISYRPLISTAITASTDEARINALLSLFKVLDVIYKIDYDDYILKL